MEQTARDDLDRWVSISDAFWLDEPNLALSGTEASPATAEGASARAYRNETVACRIAADLLALYGQYHVES